jgi:hypothetical protein
MKRILLAVLVVGVLAGQAFGGMYVLDQPTALTFGLLSNSDSGAFPAMGTLDAKTPTLTGVDFIGQLGDGSDLDQTANVELGKDGLSLAGYTGFTTTLVNNDDDPWTVQLFAQGDTLVKSGTQFLNSGQSVTLAVATTGTITKIGFSVTGLFTGILGDSPSNPDFYSIETAQVPVPGAVLLGFLGLGAAGIKLRRFV